MTEAGDTKTGDGVEGGMDAPGVVADPAPAIPERYRTNAAFAYMFEFRVYSPPQYREMTCRRRLYILPFAGYILNGGAPAPREESNNSTGTIVQSSTTGADDIWWLDDGAQDGFGGTVTIRQVVDGTITDSITVELATIPWP